MAKGTDREKGNNCRECNRSHSLAISRSWLPHFYGASSQLQYYSGTVHSNHDYSVREILLLLQQPHSSQGKIPTGIVH